MALSIDESFIGNIPADSASFTTDILRALEDYSDVTAWVNDIIEQNNVDDGEKATEQEFDLAELERRVSQLSAVLDVACEDTSAQLEKTIEDVSRTVPRLTYDLQLMHESALSLQMALQAVESRSHQALSAKETSQALEQLSFLDTVKRNMEASLAVLREAESWSSLESEVVSFLSEQSYAKAASRLSEASKSLGVFQNTPEFESRKTLLTNLQNQLEASLSSALVAGINSNDVDACKRYFDIFCRVEREAEFRSYWNGSKRKALISLWQETDLRDCGGEMQGATDSASSRRFASFLRDFYQELLSILQLERISVALIFPDPQPTLSTFITNTLTSLHPSPSQRLNQLVTHYGDFVLPELIHVFKATEEFAVSTDKIMEKVGYSGFSPSSMPPTLDERDGAPTLTRTHSRRHSQRQSFSRRLNRSSVSGTGIGFLGGAASLDNSWDEALFEPFVDYQSDYATLEKRLLRAQLNSLKSHPTSSTGARLLRERAVDVLTFADESLARCMSFTHGYGSIGLIEAIDDMFRSFMESSARDILDSDSASANPSLLPSGEEFAELDYSAADLASFQLLLHLLEAGRSILERLTVFESKLRSSLVQTANALRMSKNDPFGLYISGTTKGEINLLQGSALNSVDLQALLDEVDPDRQPGQLQTPFTPSSAALTVQKSHLGQPRSILLRGARDAISDFARTCQGRLQDIILAPLLKHLSTYRLSSLWSSSENSRDRQGGISEIVIPTFSLSPSSTIQRVAEGLLSLPRLFEVYADDDALAFSIETLPFIDEGLLKSMRTEGTSSSASPGDETSQGDRLDPPRPRSRRLSSPSLSINVLPPTQVIEPTLILTPEAVASAWLASLALTLLSFLTNNVLPSIPSLTTGGAAQLAEDLGYLSQIVKALNVEWATLEMWRELVGLDEEDLKKRLRAAREEEKDSAKENIIDIIRSIIKLRGW